VAGFKQLEQLPVQAGELRCAENDGAADHGLVAAIDERWFDTVVGP
jgi:hypothetical protein